MKFLRAVLVPAIEQSAPWLRRLALWQESVELTKREDGWHWTIETFGPDARGHLYDGKAWWDGPEEDSEAQWSPSENDAQSPGPKPEDRSDPDLEDTRFLQTNVEH